MLNDINQFYFETLLDRSQKEIKNKIILNQSEKGIDSNIIPLAIANDEDLESIHLVNYDDLNPDIISDRQLSQYTFAILKMQAGLGSSVHRSDLIFEVEGRQTLGSKGTDLYFEVDGKLTSIAQIQLKQAISLASQQVFKKIRYIDLVNEETQSAVASIWDKKINGLSYGDFFNKSDLLERAPAYVQKKMPTLNEAGQLTTQRLAPAGHGFVGFLEILDVLTKEARNEVVAIGNGEDLSSTPDVKIIKWVIEKNIPITMITTTKTQVDKKGGQISLVKEQPNYVTIVEKAQAQEANQLEYFEQLGLRKGDKISLFNTNIVIINKKALKEKFDEYLKDITIEQFAKCFAPDVIRNVKEQDAQSFTQLESALGAVMLSLDQFFRKKFNNSLVSFLNLSPDKRERFFMPIKTREDYEQIKNKYYVDTKTYRLVRK